jgi:hypothetical protein
LLHDEKIAGVRARRWSSGVARAAYSTTSTAIHYAMVEMRFYDASVTVAQGKSISMFRIMIVQVNILESTWVLW